MKKEAVKEKTITKKLTVGILFEQQKPFDILFKDKFIYANKKKLLFRARHKCTEIIKEYDEVRRSTVDKYSTAIVNDIPFNGLKDKKGMAAFEKEMDPLANEEVKVKFPKLTLTDIDINHYTAEDLDTLVTLGIIEDDLEEE